MGREPVDLGLHVQEDHAVKLYLAGILLLLSAMFAHGADETLKMIAGFIILWWAKDNMPRGKK